MKLVLVALVLAIAGCVTSPVAKLTDDTYTLSINTALGLTSRSALQDQAIGKAEEYCQTHGEAAQLVNQNTAGVSGLTNVGTTIVFRCVALDAQAAQAGR